MSNLNDMLVKGLLTRANARLDDKEQWEDITDLFTDVFYTSTVHSITSNFGRADIKAKGVFRVYLETLNLGNPGESFIGNTRVFMFTINFNAVDFAPNNSRIMSFLTDTVYNNSDGKLLGSLDVSSSESSGITISYGYGLTIISPTRKPRIFKIKRLIEND